MNRDVTGEFGLDPDVVYLNHGAFGAVPRAVQAAHRAVRDRIEANPQRFFTVERTAAVAEVRHAAAIALDLDPAAAALVRNVSEAVSTLLGSLDLAAGDEIVVSNHSYGAVRMAAETWCRRREARLTEAVFPLGASDTDIVAAFAAATTPRTRLVIVDQITSGSASVLPVAAVAAAVRAAGADLVLADAAHVPGTLPTDVAGLGVDAWVGNLHKWMFTPRGCAVLWAAAGLRARLRPLVLSWAQHEPYPANLELPGTIDDTAWLAVPAGLAYWAALGGWDQTVRNAALVATGQSIVAEALGTAGATVPAVPAPTMRLVRLPDGWIADGAAADTLGRRLSDRYAIEVPAMMLPTPDGPAGYLRIAAQVYNDVSDYEALAAALTER